MFIKFKVLDSQTQVFNKALVQRGQGLWKYSGKNDLTRITIVLLTQIFRACISPFSVFAVNLLTAQRPELLFKIVISFQKYTRNGAISKRQRKFSKCMETKYLLKL